MPNAAFAERHPKNTAVWFGEGAGNIHEIEPAARIIDQIVDEAERVLQKSLPQTH